MRTHACTHAHRMKWLWRVLLTGESRCKRLDLYIDLDTCHPGSNKISPSLPPVQVHSRRIYTGITLTRPRGIPFIIASIHHKAFLSYRHLLTAWNCELNILTQLLSYRLRFPSVQFLNSTWWPNEEWNESSRGDKLSSMNQNNWFVCWLSLRCALTTHQEKRTSPVGRDIFRAALWPVRVRALPDGLQENVFDVQIVEDNGTRVKRTCTDSKHRRKM